MRVSSVTRSRRDALRRVRAEPPPRVSREERAAAPQQEAPLPRHQDEVGRGEEKEGDPHEAQAAGDEPAAGEPPEVIAASCEESTDLARALLEGELAQVLATPIEPPRPGYCFLQDLRDEGFSPEIVSDARLASLIALASRYIESTTERFFEPRYQRIEVSGRGACEILLGEPIIALEQLALLDDLALRPAGDDVDLSAYRIYNRHITQGLFKPDDRDNPKIRPLAWQGIGCPCGVHHVRVTGLFGYTDPDGSPTGQTPRLIREVCKRLVARELPRLSETDQRENAQRRFRLVQEKNRDQSYPLDRLHLTDAHTGDPEIVSLLIQFKRPVDLGAA